VINLLCDRALDEAYRAQLRTVDASLIERAAGGLEPAGGFPGSVAEAADPLTPGPAAFDWEGPAKRRWPTRLITAFLALAVLGGFAGWFLVNGSGRGGAASPAAAPSHGIPVPAPPAAVPTPAPAPAEPAAPIASQAPLASEPPATPAATAPTAGAFEIVVASFRTEARAAEATSQVKDAGVPVRQRATGGWQQVIAGPFASRDEAEANRARLERAGFPGTQIVVTPR
jgi:cell division septation protein DedD